MKRGAVLGFERDGDYEARLQLERVVLQPSDAPWYLRGDPPPTAAWLMCNPSRANHEIDDPTMGRVMHHSARLGCPRVLVGNVWCLRTHDPAVLWSALRNGRYTPAMHEANLDALAIMGAQADVFVVAFGAAPLALAPGRLPGRLAGMGADRRARAAMPGAYRRRRTAAPPGARQICRTQRLRAVRLAGGAAALTVYVDDARLPLGRMICCHMVADDLDELHRFAAAIGCRREWYQPASFPHYDIPLFRRAAAIKLGARQLTRRELAQFMRTYRAALNNQS